MAFNTSPSCYYFTFESVEGICNDDEFIETKIYFWKLNEANNHSVVSVIPIRTVTCKIRPVDAIMPEVLINYKEALTMFGVPQECHAKLVHGWMQLLQIEFSTINDLPYLCPPRRVVMHIVEAWCNTVYDIDIENAVRRAMGVSVVGYGEFFNWWQMVEVREPVPIGDYVLVEEVWVSMRSEDLGEEVVQDVLDEMMEELDEVDAEIAIRESMEEDDASEEVSCVICFVDEEPQELTRMPCNHVFHTKCVHTWLRINPCCPICMNHLDSTPHLVS